MARIDIAAGSVDFHAVHVIVEDGREDEYRAALASLSAQRVAAGTTPLVVLP